MYKLTLFFEQKSDIAAKSTENKKSFKQ